MAAKAPAAGCWSPPGENLCSPVFRPLRENAPAGASQQKPPCTKLLLHCPVNSFLGLVVHFGENLDSLREVAESDSCVCNPLHEMFAL